MFQANTASIKSCVWLAIPTPLAPKRGVGGKRIHPGNFPEHRFGLLRFVYQRGRPSLLVLDGVHINKLVGSDVVPRVAYSRKRVA